MDHACLYAFMLALFLGCLLPALFFILYRREAKAKAKLAAAERLKDLALWGSELGIWEFDIPSGRLTQDERFCEMLGRKPGEVESDLESWLRLVHPDDLPSLRGKIAACIDGSSPVYESEHRALHKSGAWTWVLSKGRITERDVSGKPLKAAGTQQDITARKEAGLALLASEASFRSLVENLNDIIFRFGRDCRCLYASPSAGAISQIPPATCIGRTYREIGFPPELCEYFESFLKQVFASGEPAEQEFEYEAKGGRLHLNWRLFPEFGRDGKVVSVLSISRDLTKRREAERAYKSIFENMIDGFAIHELIVDTEGKPSDYRFLSVNPAFERITGLKAESILGRTVIQALPNTEKAWIERYGKVVLSGEPAHFSEYSKELDKHFEVAAYRAAPGRFACIFRDISEMVKAQEGLKMQVRLMQTILDGIPDMALLLRPDHSLLACNKSAKDFMGWEEDGSLSGRKCFSLLGLSRPCVPCPLNKAVSSGATSIRSVESPETGLCFEVRAIPILGEGGGKVEMVVELIRNVTEKRDMEKDLDRMIDSLQAEILQRMKAEEALQRSERLYRMIAETAQAGIWQLDLDGRVQFLNPRMKRLLQVDSESELTGRTCFDFVPTRSVRHIELAERGAAEGGPGVINSYEAELIGLKGERREVLVSGIVTFPSDSPKPETYIEIFMDITEMRRSEKEAESRRIKLLQAEKMASLGVLVSGVAHEINNPNNFIMLNAPILLDVWKSSLPAVERHAAESLDFSLAGIPYKEMKELVPQLFNGIFDGAERIKNIVAGLKDYARQDITDPDATADVNEAVKTSMLLLSNLVKKATRKFSVVYGKDIPPVKGSNQKIEQVVINLVQNSCQALRSHDSAIEVATSFRDGKVRIAVRDEGMGIPKANMPFITDPFFTTKRDSGGTGLGLSISSGIVNEMGGELIFESEEGKGTCASVFLPPALPPPDED